MDGGAWEAAVHGVMKSRTRLSNFTFTFHFHALEKEMATHSSVLAWRIPGTGEPGEERELPRACLLPQIQILATGQILATVQIPSTAEEKLTAAPAKSLQSCPTPCDRIDGSPPGSPVPGILQARILEWVAISFSNA